MLDKNKHEILLSKILRDIYTDFYLATILGFKGGTACYLFYKLDRFSTDLDFNIINSNFNDYSKILNHLIDISKKYGILEEAIIKRNTVLLLINYEKNMQKIKIEVSKRDFKDDYELKSLYGTSINVMSLDNMFTHKLIAVTDRKKIANRDLYDLNWFLKNFLDLKINDFIILERTKKETVNYLKFLIEYIEVNVKEANILMGLGEVLDAKQRVWIKNNLKNELVFLLKAFLKIHYK